jgi:hypothetical protein
MTVASINAGGDFRVGEVMSRAWSILTGNIVFFLTVPVLLLVSYFVIGTGLGVVFALAGGVSSPWVIGLAGIVTVIAILALNMIGQGVLLMGAFQRLRGEPLQVAMAVQRVMARFLPLLGLSILLSLGLVAAVIFSSFIFFWALALALRGLAIVLVPLIAVPPFFLLVIWLVAVPACVVEGQAAIASMLRSTDLTKGFRWKITGIALLIGVVTLLSRLLQFGLTAISPVIGVLFGLAWFVLWIAYIDCVVIMTYHDLRVAKEGVDTSQIASIFD